MPWHVENDVKIGYYDGTVKMPNAEVRLLKLDQEEEGVEVLTLSVKKFRSLVRKKKESSSLQLYACAQINTLSTSDPEN